MTREGEGQRQRLGERERELGVGVEECLNRIKKKIMQKHPHLTTSANKG